MLDEHVDHRFNVTTSDSKLLISPVDYMAPSSQGMFTFFLNGKQRKYELSCRLSL